MKWEADIIAQPSLHFEIKKDSRAGYYVYAYKNGIDTHDHLQDTLEMAKQCAFDEFGVPLDAWKQME